jgi:hypothetical protein
MRRLRVAVAALVVLGMLSMATGASGYVRGSLCDATAYVAVSPTDAEPTVAYDDLTEGDRRVFEEARESNGSVLAGETDLSNETVVVRDGEAYRVTVTGPDDCAPYHPLFVELPLTAGSGAVALGLLAAVFIRLRTNDDA